ncbi:hypothetical protein D3C86_1937710 [compost metagenome]
MGILLTFMFLWNMLGALILIPALSYFLLRGPSLIEQAVPDQPVARVDGHDNSEKPGVRHALTLSE